MIYSKLRELIHDQRYDDALGVVREFERLGCMTPEIYVWKGVCIQMSGNIDDDYQLDDVRLSYLKSIEMNASCWEAYLEMGYFNYAVEDKVKEALGYFEYAIELIKKQLNEARSGQRKCRADLEKWGDEG
jgi:tetratricopeptide (TPR) repeat protein